MVLLQKGAKDLTVDYAVHCALAKHTWPWSGQACVIFGSSARNAGYPAYGRAASLPHLIFAKMLIVYSQPREQIGKTGDEKS